MDSSKCQTLTATPAEPGELPTEIAIGSPDFECVLGADFPNLVAQERALAGRDVPEALLVLAHPGKPLLGPFDGLRVFDAGFVAPSSLLLTPQSCAGNNGEKAER